MTAQLTDRASAPVLCFPVPAREVIPHVLSRTQDTPLAGKGRAGTEAGAPAGTRSCGCHTASWRSSPPLRAARSLNLAVLAGIATGGQVCRILAARRDKTGFVRQSQRGFLVLLRLLPEKRGSTSDSSRYALAAPDPRMGFAVGTTGLASPNWNWKNGFRYTMVLLEPAAASAAA
jgi:hypothetical protein